MDITGISSMATRQLLAELAPAARNALGFAVTVSSIGGVDATRRVEAGEPFDFVVLAADAIDKLTAAGHVQPGSRVDLAHSLVAVAVRAGTPRPDISTEDALRRAVLAAASVGYSTGPSGVALMALFSRWGIGQALQPRTVQAPPGVPVGSLVASGDVALGFQQLGELMHLPGIDVVGTLPPGAGIATTFSAGICSAAPQPEAARSFLLFMASQQAAEAKQRHGMTPA